MFYDPESKGPKEYLVQLNNFLSDSNIPIDNLLVQPFTFNYDIIRNLLLQIRPNNLHIIYSGTQFDEGELSLTEPRYGAKYSLEEIPQEDLQLWTQALEDDNHGYQLAKENEFINQTPPVLINQNQQEVTFNGIEIPTPELVMASSPKVLFHSNLNFATAKTSIKLRLQDTLNSNYRDQIPALPEALSSNMEPELTMAREIGCRIEYYWDDADDSMVLSFYGNSDSVAYLTNESVGGLFDLANDESNVEVVAMVRKLRQYLCNTRLEMLVVGNISAEDAIRLINNTYDQFRSSSCLLDQQPIIIDSIDVQLNQNSEPDVQPTVTDQSHDLNYLLPIKITPVTELFRTMLHAHLFNDLRTHQHLTYPVSVEYVPGSLQITINTKISQADYDSKVNASLKSFCDNLKPEVFNRYRDSKLLKGTMFPKVVGDLADYYWVNGPGNQWGITERASNILGLAHLSFNDFNEYVKQTTKNY